MTKHSDNGCWQVKQDFEFKDVVSVELDNLKGVSKIIFTYLKICDGADIRRFLSSDDGLTWNTKNIQKIAKSYTQAQYITDTKHIKFQPTCVLFSGRCIVYKYIDATEEG